MVSVRMCAVGGVWAVWAVWVVLTWCPTEGYNLSPDHYRTMTGPEDTHFGFSVALWSDAAAYKRAVVGAPRGRNSTYGQGDVPLGNIFFCEVVGEVVCLADTRLPTVSGDDKSEAALAADKTTGFGVKTYGMGFGHSLATLKQNVSSLAACAPRYPRVEPKSIQTRGACFVLTQPGQQPHLLLPYNGRVPKVDSVQDAMLGFSAALSDLGNSLIMGGPNAFTGEGMLVNKPLDGSVHSLNRDKKTPDTPTLTLSHTYEGWSVVLGKFDSGSTYFIATSSVNYGNYTGKISFYPKKMLSAVTPLYILYGQEMGAQFGYCLGSADVDGDGVDDLLVGAPLARAGDKLLPDAGKIFLYYSPLDADKLPPSQVSGTDAWGRFGAAVTSLGDVDRDGYDDVAVAAPYAGRNRGGVVYIFNGGAGGLRTPHSQMIEASAFSEGLRGFGFSLDGGLDMDDNGYSDLVIGAAESNTALFIRSSPVVRLVGGVYFTSETVMVDDKINCKIEKAGYQTIHGVCFDLTVNITYDTYKKFDNLQMQFRIVLEGPEDPSHFGFKINNDHSFTMTRRVYFKSRNSQWSLQVFFKRVRSNIGQTLRASVTVSLLQQDADEATSDAATAAVTLAPVLDTFSASNTYVTNTTLVCPDNRTCFASPDLHLVASSHPFTLGEKSVLVEVQLQVHHDPGYQVKVEVRHPEGLEYMRVEGKGSLPFCSDQKLVNQIASSFVCVFDFIDPDVIVNFTLVFEVRAVQVLDYLTTNNLTFLTLNLHVTSDTDTENNTLNNDATVIIPVITKAILYTKAYSLLESTTVMVNQTASSEDLQKAMKDPNTSSFSVDKLGPHLLHEFSLTNRGPSPVRGAKLRFQLPLYRSDHLLTYYMGQPATTPHVTCTTITTNPYNLQTSSSSLPSVFKRSTVLPSVIAATTTTLDNTTSVTTTSEDFTFATHVYDIDDGTTSWPETLQMRHRRQVHLEEEEEEEAEGDQLITPASAFTSQPFQGRANTKAGLTKSLECNTAHCTLTCEVALLDVESTVTVSFSSHLVTAAVTEVPYRSVTVYSWMDVNVSQVNSTVINSRTSTQTQVFLLRPQERGLMDIPIWILLLAVAFSVLLVLLIIAGLWKAGFFKRHRPPTAPRESLLSSPHHQGKMEEVQLDDDY